MHSPNFRIALTLIGLQSSSGGKVHKLQVLRSQNGIAVFKGSKHESYARIFAGFEIMALRLLVRDRYPESRTGFPLCGGETRTNALASFSFLIHNLPEAAKNTWFLDESVTAASTDSLSTDLYSTQEGVLSTEQRVIGGKSEGRRPSASGLLTRGVKPGLIFTSLQFVLDRTEKGNFRSGNLIRKRAPCSHVAGETSGHTSFANLNLDGEDAQINEACILGRFSAISAL